MPVNPVFNTFQEISEQGLVEDLMIEVIQIHGLDFLYVPRKIVKMDRLLGNPDIAIFDQAMPFEAYLDTDDGWLGQEYSISKFGGLSIQECRLVVSRATWKENTGLDRPSEGDLVYFPLTRMVLEIKYIDYENPFYQLGKLYTFTLNCRPFEYSHEDIKTGNPVIDQIEADHKFSSGFRLENGGTGTFAKNEIIYQGSNLQNASAKGKVVQWNSATQYLLINDVDGEWSMDLPVKGENGASWFIFDEIREMPSINAPESDNENIENEFLDLVDVTGADDFGLTLRGPVR